MLSEEIRQRPLLMKYTSLLQTTLGVGSLTLQWCTECLQHAAMADEELVDQPAAPAGGAQGPQPAGASRIFKLPQF